MGRRETFSFLDGFRGFTSLGIAPIGHRVAFATPELLRVDVRVRAVLAPGITRGQAAPVFRDILERYIGDLRRDMVDEWERTYYGNIGVANAFVNAGSPEWFPDIAAKQTHTWHTIVRPQVLGVEFLATGLLDALDFAGIEINGSADPDGLVIVQTEEKQYVPVPGSLEIEAVAHIGGFGGV